RRHDRNTEVDLSSANHYSEPAVLRHPALGDVQLGHDLDALHDGLMVNDVNRISGAVQCSVNSVLDHNVGIASLDVNIGSAPLESIQHNCVNQLDDRRHFFVAGQSLQIQHFFAGICFSHQRHSIGAKTGGGVLKNSSCYVTSLQRLFHGCLRSHRGLQSH